MRAAIVGITGYTGIELLRLIMQHPILEVGTLHSYSYNGEEISEVFPHFDSLISTEITPFDAEKIMAENEIVFFATPSGISKDLVTPFVEKGFPVIDLSGDLRLEAGDYEQWYQKKAAASEILKQAHYAFPEFTPPNKKQLISNPGCYATTAILGLVPLIKNQAIALDSIIIDGKSGLTGAGKALSETSHFVNVNENMKLYKLNQHQHIPEIIQFLRRWEDTLDTIQFTTSLLPLKRGIFTTIYAKVKEGVSVEMIQNYFNETYADKPFVRVQPEGQLPELRQVVGSNYCDIGFGLNQKNKQLTLVVVIDNLVKGAAGQAIQNFNLWAEIDETSGLQAAPLFP